MQTLRFETTVPPDGELRLRVAPFRPGDGVEIIVLPLGRDTRAADDFPLANTVLKFDDPIEPVAQYDTGRCPQ